MEVTWTGKTGRREILKWGYSTYANNKIQCKFLKTNLYKMFLVGLFLSKNGREREREKQRKKKKKEGGRGERKKTKKEERERESEGPK